MQIQISWLLKKPTDLDLHCLQRQGISAFSMTRVKTNFSDSTFRNYLRICRCSKSSVHYSLHAEGEFSIHIFLSFPRKRGLATYHIWICLLIYNNSNVKPFFLRQLFQNAIYRLVFLFCKNQVSPDQFSIKKYRPTSVARWQTTGTQIKTTMHQNMLHVGSQGVFDW